MVKLSQQDGGTAWKRRCVDQDASDIDNQPFIQHRNPKPAKSFGATLFRSSIFWSIHWVQHSIYQEGLHRILLKQAGTLALLAGQGLTLIKADFDYLGHSIYKEDMRSTNHETGNPHSVFWNSEMTPAAAGVGSMAQSNIARTLRYPPKRLRLP